MAARTEPNEAAMKALRAAAGWDETAVVTRVAVKEVTKVGLEELSKQWD